MERFHSQIVEKLNLEAKKVAENPFIYERLVSSGYLEKLIELFQFFFASEFEFTKLSNDLVI